MGVLRAGALPGLHMQPTAQVIDGSLKFDNSKTTNLSRTPSSEGNRKTWTWSGWFNRQNIGANDNIFKVAGSSSKATQFTIMIHNGNYVSIDYGGAFYLKTNRLLRDTSGWYHFVVTVDTTLSTADNRIRLYINGVEETSFATRNNPNLNEDLGVNRTSAHTISTGDSSGFDGLLSNFYLIDGAALGPENFGFTDPLTNTWRPKKYNHRTDLYGVTWSSALVGDASGFQAAATAADGFNGKTGTADNSYAQNNTGSNPSTITFTPVGGIKFNSSIQVYLINNANTVNVNGEGAQSIAQDQWVTVKTGSGTLNTLVFSRASTSGASFGGIRIDGHILIDAQHDNSFHLPMDGNSSIGQDKSGGGNNFTPVNFGGSVALDNPQVSGARPILNTLPGGANATVGVFGSRNNVGYAVTYADDGGGNKYYIDGVKQATLTGLIRGATYTFDTVALGSTHPLRFSATSAHGTEYTNGVAAVTGAATTITIPHDAPNTLYYYCTSHSGMGSSITGITTNEKIADQFASNCILGLPLIGSDNDVSASIACTSSTKAITSNGDPSASSVRSNFYNGSFHFDGTGDYLSVGSASDFEVGSDDFTIEMWLNMDATSSTCSTFFSKGNSSSVGTEFLSVQTTGANTTIGFFFGSGTALLSSTEFNLDTWHHVAVTRSGNTFRLFIDGDQKTSTTSSTTLATGVSAGVIVAAQSFDVSADGRKYNGYMQDLRVYKGVAKYTSDFVVASTSPDILPDTPSGVSGSSKLTKITDGSVAFDGTDDFLTVSSRTDFGLVEQDWTVECYAYITGTNGTGRLWYLEGDSNSSIDGVYFSDTNMSMGTTGSWSVGDGTGGDYAQNKWIHVAVCHDSTNMRMYIDGVQSLTTTNNFYNSSSKKLTLMSTNNGSYSGLGIGFISNFRVINGTALYTKNFTPPTAPLTDVTNTKLLCCQSSTLTTSAAVISAGSFSANGNAAANNFNPFNTDINTVRGQETAYPTLNPLNLHNTADTLSEGNLKLTSSGSGVGHFSRSTITMSSGKYFCEVKWLDVGQNFCGIQGNGDINYNNSYVYLSNAKASDTNGSSEDASYGSTWTTGDTIGVAYDADNKTLEFFKNGVSQGIAFTNITGTYGFYPTEYVFFFGNWSAQNATYVLNFGQKPFKFSPPDGFKPLNNTSIISETVTVRPDKYVGITTWRGNDTQRDISTLSMKPDLVWIKQRTGSANHSLMDTVRGATKNIVPNDTQAEGTETGYLNAFIDNGFSLGTSSVVNDASSDYVAWAWKAGGSKNTFNVDDVGYASAAAAGLNGGNKTPTGASVGTKQGFSIIKFTNDSTNPITLSHGLTQAPTFVLLKALTGSVGWTVGHTSIGFTKRLKLNGTDAESASANYFNDTAPTSSLITLGANNVSNDFIMYSWHDVPGLQKFGHFTANASGNGPFVELGFRPSILWVKASSSAGDMSYASWLIVDGERSPTNAVKKALWANKSAAEGKRGNGSDSYTDAWLDILSNGFKIRYDGTDVNGTSGQSYIYCAWAEAPTVNLFGGSSNAR